jgi:hypothetical protein
LPGGGKSAGEEVAEGEEAARVLVVAQAAGGFGEPHGSRPVSPSNRSAGFGQQAGAPVF